MSRKLPRSIVIVLFTAAVLTLGAILSLLVGVLRGKREILDLLDRLTGNSTWNLLGLTIAVLVLLILFTLRDKFAKKETLTTEDLKQSEARIIKAITSRQENAAQQGLLPAQSPQDKDAEITRLTRELHKLQQEVAARSSEPPEAELSKLLGAGDLDGALRLKSQQLEASRGAAGKIPLDLYELGVIHELRFEWLQALEAFREAWDIGHDPEHRFKYAYFAQKLNRFNEAIGAYEGLLHIYTEPVDRAAALNNLAALYRATQRMKEAEQAYAEALATYRKLAEANPEAYLPNVATTLNNLANLYSDTQRMKEAEQAYAEALATYRKLAEANPEAYLPDVAMTLNNLANLYRATQRMKEAEQAYAEALATYRKLAEANPEAYLPNVATTLNNLAYYCLSNGRVPEAETYICEAESTLNPLWQANPELHGNWMARILWTRSLVSEAGGQPAEACAFARRAFEAAYDPEVKLTIQQLIDRLCPDSEDQTP